MKHVKQFFIIMMITFLAEILRFVLPFQIPVSIYGLITMFLLLSTNVVKLEQVKETSSFLLEIMPVLFIPSAVALVVYWNEFKSMLVPLVVIMVVSTILVMAVSGKVCDKIILTRRNNG